MQNELQRLIRTYQQDKQINVYYDEDCKYESSLLKKLFPYLRQYERPDIIATQDDELLIMEHFIFDGTKESRKGMKGRQEENDLTNDLNNNAIYYDKKLSIRKPLKIILLTFKGISSNIMLKFQTTLNMFRKMNIKLLNAFL